MSDTTSGAEAPMTAESARVELDALHGDTRAFSILSGDAPGGKFHPEYEMLAAKRSQLTDWANPEHPDGTEGEAQDFLDAGNVPPETPAGYMLDGVHLDPGEDDAIVTHAFTAVKDWAHTLGASQSEFRSVVAAYNELAADPDAHSEAKVSAQASRTLGRLQSIWGDKYDAKLATARGAAKSMGPEFISFLNNSGLGDDATTILMLAETSERKARRENSTRSSAAAPAVSAVRPAVAIENMTPAQAKAEIAKMHGDQRIMAILMGDAPGLGKMHPEFTSLNARRSRLFDIANPET